MAMSDDAVEVRARAEANFLLHELAFSFIAMFARNPAAQVSVMRAQAARIVENMHSRSVKAEDMDAIKARTSVLIDRIFEGVEERVREGGRLP